MPYLEKAESDHPEFHGVRIETGYEITDAGPTAMSKKMDAMLCCDWSISARRDESSVRLFLKETS